MQPELLGTGDGCNLRYTFPFPFWHALRKASGLGSHCVHSGYGPSYHFYLVLQLSSDSEIGSWSGTFLVKFQLSHRFLQGRP